MITKDRILLLAASSILLNLLLIAFLLVQFIYTKHTFPDPPSWLLMYHAKCPGRHLTNFADGSLLFGGVSFFFFGAYLSNLIYPSKESGGSSSNLIRVPVGIGMVAACFMPLLIQDKIENVLIRFLICYLIPAHISGFLMFKPSEWMA